MFGGPEWIWVILVIVVTIAVVVWKKLDQPLNQKLDSISQGIAQVGK